jgi:hypothetical protein
MSRKTPRLDSLEALMECLKEMESSLMGMKQLRSYIGKGVSAEMLESCSMKRNQDSPKLNATYSSNDTHVRW